MKSGVVIAGDLNDFQSGHATDIAHHPQKADVGLVRVPPTSPVGLEMAFITSH